MSEKPFERFKKAAIKRRPGTGNIFKFSSKGETQEPEQREQPEQEQKRRGRKPKNAAE